MEGLERGWLLAWYGSRTPFFRGIRPQRPHELQESPVKFGIPSDCPVLILPGSKLSGLSISTLEGLVLEFEEGPGRLALIPLFGERLLDPRKTDAWAQQVPAAVIDRCNQWAAYLAKIPVDARESYEYDRASDTVTIKEMIRFRELRPGGRPHAPLPPLMGVAMLEGFPLRLSHPAATDLDYLTRYGAYVLVPGVEKYEIRLRGLGKYVTTRDPRGPHKNVHPELLAELEREVTAILDAGHLAPYQQHLKNVVEWYTHTHVTTINLVHGDPGDVLEFLAAALPFLRPELRAKTLAYLRDERRKYPPENITQLSGIQGAPRRTPAQKVSYRESRVRRYGDRIYGAGGVIDINNHFAASIGHIRLVRLANDPVEETLAWGLFARIAALRYAIGKMAAHLHKRKLLDMPVGWPGTPDEMRAHPELELRRVLRLDQYGMQFAQYYGDYQGRGLLMLRDTTRELCLFVKDYLHKEAAAYFNNLITHIPDWYLSWSSSSISFEATCFDVRDRYQVFMACALVLNKPAEWLYRHLDLPWVARGDLYYIGQLVETIRAH